MEDITMFGIAGMPAIMVICLVAGIAAKNIQAISDKWIPVICGVLGGILGAVGMHIMPEFPAHDYISAVAVGAISGLAATGAHQIYKQFYKEANKPLDADVDYKEGYHILLDELDQYRPEEEDKDDG